MKITEPFVLPADLVFITHSELSEELRRKLEAGSDDVVVTRPNGRSGSKVVGGPAATFLRSFGQPRTIVDAVIDLSQRDGRDPEGLLDEVYPLVELMVKSRFLIGVGESEEQGQGSLAHGHVVDGWIVTSIVNRLEDSELYRVIAETGEEAALKIVRPGFPAVEAQLRREASVLEHLAGSVSPRLLGVGEHDGRSYLLMEWCGGRHVTQLADALRNSGDDTSRRHVDRLCTEIFAAYARLHEAGVVHGDVHPGNILADGVAELTLIDFGHALMIDDPSDPADARRAAVPIFMDPEYARSRLERTEQPRATFSSDQHAAAAVVFRLLTGQHYLDLAPERRPMLEQIAGEAPRSFADCGATPRPRVEAALARALSKRPEDRFATMAEFCDEFRSACQPESVATQRRVVSAEAVDSRLVMLRDRFFERCGTTGPLIDLGLDRPPTASVNTGAAGLAYAFYAEAVHRADPDLLATADVWIERALAEAEGDGAFDSKELGITPETVGGQSFYHRQPGLECVRGLIAAARGDMVGFQRAVEAYANLARSPMEKLDLTLGRMGVVLGAAILRTVAPGSVLVDLEPLDSAIRVVLEVIWSELDALPPIRDERHVEYLGVAHGWAGLIYATLQWCSAAGDRAPASVLTRLEQLTELGSGRDSLRWPQKVSRHHRKPTSMPGWCNGSAGFVFLGTAAAEHLGAEWLTVAERAAMDAWSDSDGVPNLCCGLAGRGFALLHLYRVTGSRIWLDRAREVAGRAAERGEMGADGLYKGDAGLALLGSGIEDPDHAFMPLFELPRAGRGSAADLAATVRTRI